MFYFNTFIEELRMRPLAHRRALAIATYLILAALCIFLWTRSFRISIEPNDGSPEKSIQEVLSPLSAIRADLGQFGADLRKALNSISWGQPEAYAPIPEEEHVSLSPESPSAYTEYTDAPVTTPAAGQEKNAPHLAKSAAPKNIEPSEPLLLASISFPTYQRNYVLPGVPSGEAHTNIFKKIGEAGPKVAASVVHSIQELLSFLQ